MSPLLARIDVTNLIKNYGLIALLYLILAVSLIVRTINLNYNSAFNDEAIYVVLGRFGLFQHDWVTYGSGNWVAGSPILYPSLSALAYSAGGLIGSRFLSVIFGILLIEAIFTLTVQLTNASKTYQYLAGVVAAAIVGAAGVALYVSRLATYDAPSFYLFVISLVFLHKALDHTTNQGKWFFIASLCLLGSALTKIIIVIYLPLLFVYSFWLARNHGPKSLFFWKRYFVLPLVVGLGLYGLFNFNGLHTYQTSQSDLEWYDWKFVTSAYFENAYFVWFFFLLTAFGLYLKRAFPLMIGLALASLWILFFHIATNRYSTLDKHTLLSIIFLAPAVGIGFAYLIELTKNKFVRIGYIAIAVVMLTYYWFQVPSSLALFNSQWANTSVMNTYLGQTVKPGDKILAESGAAIILAVYDKNYPINVTTFDWLEYQKLTDDRAYTQALTDGYFDLIQLETHNHFKEDFVTARHDLVMNHLSDNYRLIYSRQGYEIYRRIN